MVTETAKPTAAARAMIWPGTISLVPGRTMMTTPITPSATARFFHSPMRSPRKATARIAVQIGMVNSIEMT